MTNTLAEFNCKYCNTQAYKLESVKKEKSVRKEGLREYINNKFELFLSIISYFKVSSL